MDISIINHNDSNYPIELRQLHRPPSKLYCRGRELSDILSRPRVAIVGSRNVTPYGRQVTEQFAQQLARQGIVIISGLALGVDAIAHQAALDAGGITMAVLPSPVESPAPSSNQQLARQIINQGGTLLSTYPSGQPNHKLNFVERNEYVAALSQAVLITEAATKSGTTQTAAFALELGVSVLAVPGNIGSLQSAGANQLIKSAKASIATQPQDIIHELGLDIQLTLPMLRGDTAAEQTILDLLQEQVSDGSLLFERSALSISEYNQTLTVLEVSGKVRAIGSNHWALA